MKQLLQKLLFVCILCVNSVSLHSMEGFRLPSFSTDDKDLYEMIDLNKDEYDRRRDQATAGIVDMDYDAVVAELQSISGAKKLISELQKVKKEKDALDAELARDPLGVERAMTRKTTKDEDDRKLAELNAQYDYLMYQARGLIKQKAFKDKGFDAWAAQEITTKCKQTQRAIRKEIDKIEQEIKYYPKEQTDRLQKQLRKEKEKLLKLSEGCTFLMNPKFRAQYDAELETTYPPSMAFENVKDAVESSMRLAGTGTRIQLNAIIGDMLSRELQIPDAATKLFNQDLQLTNIRVLPKPQGEDIKYYIGFTGTTVFNSFSLTVNVYIVWDIYNQVRFSIGIATPDNYRITHMFPNLRALNWMQFPKGKFVAANFKGIDIDGYQFEKGFNFVGEWDFFLSGPLSFLKKLASAAPQISGLNFKAEPVKLDMVIPKWNILRTTAKATLPLEIGVDFTKINRLPRAFTSVINGIHLTSLGLSISPSAPTLERQETELARLKFIRDEARQTLNDMPKDSELKRVYEAAEKRYESERRRVEGVQQDQAKIAERKRMAELAAVEKEEGVVGLQSLFEEEGEKAVQAHYATTPKIVERMGAIPSRISTKVGKEVTQGQRNMIMREARLDQFEKFGFTTTVKGVAELKLGTQPDPLRLIVSGMVQPPGLKHPQGFLSFSMALENMLEFGWLAIGNAGIVLDIDVSAVQALIAFGIPVSGVFINGQVDLGKPGESRASLKAGGGVSVTAKKPIDVLIFDVSGENIRPTDFARFVGYQLMKSKYIGKGVSKLSEQGSQLYNRVFPKSGGVPSLSLPEIIFHKVWGYAALGSATIGKQSYRSGLGLQVELEVMKQKAGMRIFIGDKERGYSIEGFGYLPSLSLSIKGRDLIKLYSSGDPSKGPLLTWNFNPKELFGVAPSASRLETARERATAVKEDIIKGGALSLDAVLELPMMGLKQKAKFAWAGYTIDADFESEIAGYTLLFGIKMNTRGEEIDEARFIAKLDTVRSALSKKVPTDTNAEAALLLLRAAESKQTYFGMALLDKADKVLQQAAAKPSDTQGFTSRMAEATSKAYAKGGVRGVVGAGISGVKGAVFGTEVEIPRHVQVDVMRIFINESLKAEFEALQKQASDVGINIQKSLSAEYSGTKAALESGDQKVFKTELQRFKAALNEQLVDKRPDIGLNNWQGMLVKFGFKNVNKLAHQITEQLVPYLNRLKESYTQRIAAVDEKAKRWETGDINTTKEKEAIARREAKIMQMKEICSKRSRTSQIACQSKIKFEQTKLLKDKAILKAFIESRASKDIKRMTAIGYRKARIGKALKVVGEKSLSAITTMVGAIAKGVDILNITEILGQYSYRDMVNLRLPRLVRLVAELNIMEMTIPIVLKNLQFDFRNPGRSVRAIAHAIFDSTQQALEKEYMSPEMQELLHEAIGQ